MPRPPFEICKGGEFNNHPATMKIELANDLGFGFAERCVAERFQHKARRAPSL